ncbi:hypothetical protein [Candidatus Poriferisocius sp.]|uniref:hypothetical protein n=1 Tax=Candidatus Poriferisocius sp. TaxID=3101276 RepID=UPI003B0214C6
MSLLGRLRWESIVPYDDGFTGYHHPEVPGGRLFLTAASRAGGAVRHWTALRPGATLNVVDHPVNGCLWTATGVGVSLRELLPYETADLAKLKSPGPVAAEGMAKVAAAQWDWLSTQRKQWFRTAFSRNDPPVVWCPPNELPRWTVPEGGVLSLSPAWEAAHGHCRWSIPRRGFWMWRLQVRYTSEQGDHHTVDLADDLSWFREPTEYLGERISIW